MKYFFNFKNMKYYNYFYVVLPTALYGVSITCYSFYKELFNNKKIETDVYDQYRTFREN